MLFSFTFALQKRSSSRLETVTKTRGGSRIFSRGGGRIFKKNSKILTTFFLGRPNWFLELSQSTFLPTFWLNFLRRRQISEKTVKKAVFGHFLKNFDKKIAFFFGARSPSKLVYIGTKGAFRKILGSVGQKWISEKVSKGGPFGSAGGRQGVFFLFYISQKLKTVLCILTVITMKQNCSNFFLNVPKVILKSLKLLRNASFWRQLLSVMPIFFNFLRV